MKKEEEKPKYNILIIGAGGQGALADAPGSRNEHKIISFGHAFKKHHGFWLAGFYDKDLCKTHTASTIWKCCSYIDLKQAFEPRMYHKIDVAVVTTPDNTHYEILKQLAEYPLKLVICEKPLCEDLQQAREIVELYSQKNIPLMVNYTRRFLPYYQDLKQKYKNGDFGRLIDYNILFNKGMLHTGTHAIDFITWFTDFKLTNGLEMTEMPIDYRVWQIQLFFEKYFWQEQRIGDMPVWNYYDKSHWHVVKNAYNFLEGKEEIKCTGEDALKSLEICYKFMENNKNNNTGEKV